MELRKLLVLSGFLSVTLISCKSVKTAEDITPYAATESYPVDTVLSSITEKRAMIVVAHDDDMCLTAGTISKLNKDGWDIRVLSMPQSDERNAAQLKACSFILDSVLLFDMPRDSHRNDLDTCSSPHSAIPRSKFKEIFNTEIIEKDLIRQVNGFEPSVIFTLDNEIGGYGHPDHVMISQLVLDLALSDSIHPSYIYQSVYTDHMINSIMERHSIRMKSWGFPGGEWTKSKETYQVDGMPEPTVQIDIRDQAEEKMNYLNSYNERERKTIGFYIPAFMEYKAEDYFEVFDREFYHVIKINP